VGFCRLSIFSFSAKFGTVGSVAEGLRERKKQETRIALSWAAVRLTVERGLANVRIEDIAAEAGVSLRTFRNYFSSKAEAIAAREVDRSLAIAAELRARPAD
jgi:AcrR family transcriptional regulator